MTNNLKITIIILYNNAWPEWFNFFLQSCETNKSVNWLIFSENETPERVPVNVRFINISNKDLTYRIKEQLEIKPLIIHPFKFSDFKPAYGLIFNDYIKDSTFWGYCDIDLVFGDISYFITDDIFENYDIISPSADFFPGHFLLMRNIDKINNLFKLAQNWKEVLTKPECYCFDEKIFLPPIQPDSNSIQTASRKKVQRHLKEYRFIRNPFFHFLNQGLGGTKNKRKIRPNEIKDLNSAIKYSQNEGNIRTLKRQWFSDDVIKLRDRNKDFMVVWKEGKLFDGEKEILYFHFPISKYSSSFRINEINHSQFTLLNEHLQL